MFGRSITIRWLAAAHAAVGLSVAAVLTWQPYPVGFGTFILVFLVCTTIFLSQANLLAMWLALGDAPWQRRFGTTLLGVLFIVSPIYLSVFQPDEDQLMVISQVFVVVCLAILLAAAPLTVLRLVFGPLTSRPRDMRERWQFTMRNLLFTIMTLSICLAIGRVAWGLMSPERATDVIEFGVPVSACGVGATLLAVTLVFRIRNLLLWGIVLALVAGGAFVGDFTDEGLLIVVLGDAAILVVSLIVVRLSGHRFAGARRETAPTGVESAPEGSSTG